MGYIVFSIMRATSLKVAQSLRYIYIYYKYLIIYIILIIMPIIMTSESVPTTLCPMMTSTCVISGDAVLIAEGWLALHDADARHQGEQYLLKCIH